MAARLLLLLSLLALLLPHGLSQPQQLGAPVVAIPGLGTAVGRRGVHAGATGSVALWLGLPYARAPVGALRWQPPQPHPPWGKAAKDATRFGGRCMQAGQAPGTVGGGQAFGALGASKTGEDCLFLNVAAPASASSRLPVAIWIHGGGYVKGSSNDWPLDSLAARANGSLVVVSLNYRLGVFGFLASGELANRSAAAGLAAAGPVDPQPRWRAHGQQLPAPCALPWPAVARRGPPWQRQRAHCVLSVRTGLCRDGQLRHPGPAPRDAVGPAAHRRLWG